MGPSLTKLGLAERTRLFNETLPNKSAGLWKRALEPAREAARRERKLILFFQLVGDLDLEGC